ncbi:MULTISPECIES: cupin-like domain-containing protein [unclassified Sphingopyxis]|uniref:cupin-like domain-containing protein n=1 Tax=unclassified Sphingopyxis TaxID=2614943 RepID=UPI00073757DD|nr:MULTISPECIES: cupin-like domain-containing protein [unclassified Sphingopyxis]KTE38983.1 transcription factor jumonji jmjc domain-containing protein [Sphingopyxis sp. HIX]KTE84790.1 transcription factor jumonji jmjc domain-containing protein [Sphingopyxis sp. HXXIV]
MAEPARLDPPAAAPSPLDALPRIAARSAPAPADFAALVAAGKPVVVKGLFDDWIALAAGRHSPGRLNAYLAGLDRGVPVPVMEAPARAAGRFAYRADIREFSFTKRHAPLRDTLARIETLMGQANAPTVAIQMLPLAEALPDFLGQNPMPLLPADTGPKLWLGGAVKTQTHNDRDHNLACVIAGRRRFLLFPPEQVANLYIGPLDNPPPLSLVDPENPDYTRYPRFREAMAEARVAMLEPGDAIFIPRYWWHHVTSLDPYNAMVNYWWGGAGEGVENPHDIFLAALLALRDLPPGERAYWQAMFDAHVFGDAAAAAAHIPEGLRGVLGPMPAAERAALRRRLSAAFDT